jgi:hypothetical protein
MYSDIARGINSYAYLVASDFNDGDTDVVTDDYGFVALT